MHLFDALRVAPLAIQRRGDTIYEVRYRPPAEEGAACYLVKRYPATQLTGPIIRALAAEGEALALFVHHQLALDPTAWEAVAPRPPRTDAPSLQSLLQVNPGVAGDLLHPHHL
jgi:hypothetical protein